MLSWQFWAVPVASILLGLGISLEAAKHEASRWTTVHWGIFSVASFFAIVLAMQAVRNLESDMTEPDAQAEIEEQVHE